MSFQAIARDESYSMIKQELSSRQLEVLNVLKHRHPLTAWEISDILQRPVYQIRPRLTELEIKGKINVIGLKYQERTRRKESIYSYTNIDHNGQLRIL